MLDKKESPRPVGKLLSEVEPEQVEWLWPGRLPLGKLAVLDGDPGLGKSALTLDLAARVSAGLELPDGSRCGPAGVVLLSAEDGLEDTIRPRLDAAGADTERIVALSMIGVGTRAERLVSLTQDLDAIEAAIRRVGAALVVIDPLMAFLTGKTDSHKDQDIRRALAPLAALAERTGAAVLIVRHLNKSAGGNALYRGGGSIGIIGAARAGLVVAPDPEDPERRILAANKHNLSGAAPSLVFRVEAAPNGAARVAWGQPQGGLGDARSFVHRHHTRHLQPRAPRHAGRRRQSHGRGAFVAYCCPTAAKAPGHRAGGFALRPYV